MTGAPWPASGRFSGRPTVQAEGARPILIAWEQGGNLGHLLRIKAVVELLREQQREAILAVSHVLGNQFAEALAGIPCAKVVVRCAAREGRHHPNAQAASFAGVLSGQGWTDEPWLRNSMQAWVNLCQLTKPAAVVLDYAPVASLAACVLRIPALQISSGFDAPPPTRQGLGRFRSRTGEISVAEAAEVAAVDAAIARVIATLGHQGPAPFLREVLAYPRQLLDCLPQTDPYGARENAVYAPFLSRSSTPAHASWPGEPSDPSRTRAFVYVREPIVAEQLLHALARRKVSTLCFWPGYSGHLPFMKEHGISVHAQPLDLNDVFREASFVVSYGSVGIATRAVLAGIPQIVIPTDIEKGMVAQRLHEQGLGICLKPRRASHGLDKALDQMLGTDVYRERCKAIQLQVQCAQAERTFSKEIHAEMDRLTGQMWSIPMGASS
ncbi:glycosyltransferase [Hydrogenophaga sp.]|uniref:glycosyltransferase n=1 Tax=Hydrogenophaga sp. TaxID=1904254 RepID=UPI003D09E4B4